MKFLHISDLHFGKIMNEIPLIENDQPFWKDRFMEVVCKSKADAVVIAGDVYDRSNPSNEAVKLLDNFITELSEKNIPVFIVAGNHDSGQKLSFAESVLEKGNIYIAGVPSAKVKHIELEDEYGTVTFWLVPYIFPQEVNYLLDCKDIHDYDTAFRRLLDAQNIDFSKRNVIVAHQNVTRNGAQAERGGSESMVAGVGGIEYTAFDGFEYAALGHIHRAQYVGRKCVRYAGSPLCYHFDESKFSDKGAVLVELKEKGEEPDITVIPIEPLHHVRIIRGTYQEIVEHEMNNTAHGEYLRAEITDKHPDSEMCSKLRSIAEMHGSIFMEIVPVIETNNMDISSAAKSASEKKSIQEMFYDLYAQVNNSALPDEKESELIEKLVNEMANTDIYEKNAHLDIAEKLIAASKAQEVDLYETIET